MLIQTTHWWMFLKCSYCSSARATSRNPAAEVLLRSHVTLLQGKVMSCSEYKPPYYTLYYKIQRSLSLCIVPFTWAWCWSAGLCSASWLRCRPCCSRSGPLFSGRCCSPGRWPERFPESAGATRSATGTAGPAKRRNKGGGGGGMLVCFGRMEGERSRERLVQLWNLLQSDVTARQYDLTCCMYELFTVCVCSDIDTVPASLPEKQ